MAQYAPCARPEVLLVFACVDRLLRDGFFNIDNFFLLRTAAGCEERSRAEGKNEFRARGHPLLLVSCWVDASDCPEACPKCEVSAAWVRPEETIACCDCERHSRLRKLRACCLPTSRDGAFPPQDTISCEIIRISPICRHHPECGRPRKIVSPRGLLPRMARRYPTMTGSHDPAHRRFPPAAAG